MKVAWRATAIRREEDTENNFREGLAEAAFCRRQRSQGLLSTKEGEGLKQNAHLGKEGRALRVGGVCLAGSSKSQVLPDMLGEIVFDFCVSGHRLLLASLRIEIDVVAGAGPEEYAAVPHQLTNELPPFHTAMAFSRWF